MCKSIKCVHTNGFARMDSSMKWATKVEARLIRRLLTFLVCTFGSGSFMNSPKPPVDDAVELKQ